MNAPPGRTGQNSLKPEALVLWVVFCFPVGLLLLWLDPRPSLKLKQGVTAFFAIAFIAVGAYDHLPAGRAAQAQQDKADAVAAAQQKTADAEQAKKDAVAAIPEPVRRYPVLAKFSALTQVIDKQTNDTPPLPKLKSFKYDPSLSMVMVEINMDQNLTANMTKSGVHMEMADIYTAIFHDGKIKPKIAEVRVFGSLEDKFGHTSQGIVYDTAMDKATADQVNWAAGKSELELNILPGLWIPYYNFQNSF